ncbi:MAG: N-formylglutamate amidohydrolase [Verrucomicrobia bacterium]|nr:N-formylglutamate amidohydrolase [Verrucomicrobiota bacterium]
MPTFKHRSVVVSCEHAVHTIPQRWAFLFSSQEAHDLLETHRGWDPGAAEIAIRIAAKLNCPCVPGDCSRLLVELNRSLDNPEIWSQFTAPLSHADKDLIVRSHYEPFRRHCRELIEAALTHPNNLALHVSVHTFTPFLYGHERMIDVGILFDPKRPLEARFAQSILHHLKQSDPTLRIAFNQPYSGTDDGHTTALRTLLHSSGYVGLEIEVNQAILLNQPSHWRSLIAQLTAAIGAQI